MSRPAGRKNGETREVVMAYLRSGLTTTAELSQHLDLNQSTVHYHLSKLREAGLVATTGHGTWQVTVPEREGVDQ
jgi:DNA-binding transcriptional ArsR family regulator